MADIRILCPGCGVQFNINDSCLGMRARCKRCNASFLIAWPESAAPITKTQTLPDDGAETGPAEQDAPSKWQKGHVALGLYRVLQTYEGGMGLVYRVRHKTWNVDLAVKCPQIKNQRVDQFVEECERWISLGLHPHIVSCYYVRKVGRIPHVFAEYIEGGSLEDWIRDRLYDGGQEKALERILDIAIQFAWGLGYAHDKGLVHQDVKPLNVMMTRDGTAKVTDFGLGTTPAYRSPEQSQGRRLSRQTDIWSWGLSVLEMFTGGVSWRVRGERAAEVLDDYLREGPEDKSVPRMLDGIVELLRRCFQHNPEDRPKDFAEVVAQLKKSYKEATQHAYPREDPQVGNLLAGSLNNRAISQLDLGRKDTALEVWHEALTADPMHLESVVNFGSIKWQDAQIPDDEFVRRLTTVCENSGTVEARLLLAHLHLLRNRPEEAGDALRQCALAETPETPLPWQYWRMQGLVLAGLGEGEEAADCFARARSQSPDALEPAGSACSPPPVGIVSKDTLRDIPSAVWGLAFHQDGRLAFSSGRVILHEDVYDDPDHGSLEWWTCDPASKSVVAGNELTSVANIAASHDGRILATGTGNHLVLLHERRTIELSEKIRHVALSPEGDHVCLCYYGEAELRDAHSGDLKHTFYATSSICSAFSCNGSLVAVAHESGTDGFVTVYDVRTGQAVHQLGEFPVHALAWLDERAIALGGYQFDFISIADIAGAKPPYFLRGHTAGISCLVCSVPQPLLWSGGLDGTVRLWDVGTGRCLTTLTASAICQSLALSCDRRMLAAGGAVDTSGIGGDIRVWTLSSLEKGPGIEPLPVLVSRPESSRRTLEMAAKAKTLRHKARESFDQEENPQAAVALLREAQAAMGYQRDMGILEEIRRCTHGAPLVALRGVWPRLRLTQDWVKPPHVCLDVGHQRAALVAGGCLVDLLEAAAQSVRSLRVDANGRVAAAAFTADGQTIVMCLEDQLTIRSVNIQTGKVENILDLPEGQGIMGVRDMAFSADQRHAVFSCHGPSQGMILHVDWANREILHQWKYMDHFVWSNAISADGRIAAVATNYQTGGQNLVRIYDLERDAEIGACGGFRKSAACVSLTADARFLAAGTFGGEAFVWDLPADRPLVRFQEHEHDITCIDLSPDGRFCLAGAADRCLYLWEVGTGRCLSVLRNHRDAIRKAAFTPSLHQALCVDARGEMTVWELDWETEIEKTPQTDDRLQDVAPEQPAGRRQRQLKCPYCGARHPARLWPEGGDRAPFRYVAEEKVDPASNALALPIECPSCRKRSYAVWDHDPDPILRQFLNHLGRIRRSGMMQTLTLEWLQEMICDEVLGRHTRFAARQRWEAGREGEVLVQTFVARGFFNVTTVVPTRVPEEIRRLLGGSYFVHFEDQIDHLWDSKKYRLAHWVVGIEGLAVWTNLTFRPADGETRPNNTILATDLLTPRELHDLGL